MIDSRMLYRTNLHPTTPTILYHFTLSIMCQRLHCTKISIPDYSKTAESQCSTVQRILHQFWAWTGPQVSTIAQFWAITNSPKHYTVIYIKRSQPLQIESKFELQYAILCYRNSKSREMNIVVVYWSKPNFRGSELYYMETGPNQISVNSNCISMRQVRTNL